MLGCLIEKARTTPDQYPLTRNAVRLAANQATNRDPVVDYDEATVRAALERLGRNGLVRFTSTRGSRAAKYRHLAGNALGVGEADLAVLALLMLRGPQTPGELRGRAERLHSFTGTSEVEETLSRLTEKELAVRFERRPGQKEQRFAHLLSDERADDAGGPPAQQPHDVGATEARGATPAADPDLVHQQPPISEPDSAIPGKDPLPPAASGMPEDTEPSTQALETRVAALEAELRTLREQLSDLLED